MSTTTFDPTLECKRCGANVGNAPVEHRSVAPGGITFFVYTADGHQISSKLGKVLVLCPNKLGDQPAKGQDRVGILKRPSRDDRIVSGEQAI